MGWPFTIYLAVEFFAWLVLILNENLVLCANFPLPLMMTHYLPTYFFFLSLSQQEKSCRRGGETVSWGTQYLNTVTGFSLAVSSLTATSLLLPPANPSLPTPSCKWVLRVSVAVSRDWLQAVCRHLSFRMDIDLLSREESFQRCSVCHGCLAF